MIVQVIDASGGAGRKFPDVPIECQVVGARVHSLADVHEAVAGLIEIDRGEVSICLVRASASKDDVSPSRLRIFAMK